MFPVFETVENQGKQQTIQIHKPRAVSRFQSLLYAVEMDGDDQRPEERRLSTWDTKRRERGPGTLNSTDHARGPLALAGCFQVPWTCQSALFDYREVSKLLLRYVTFREFHMINDGLKCYDIRRVDRGRHLLPGW